MPATSSMLRAAGRREPQPAQGIRRAALNAKHGQLSVPSPSLRRMGNLNIAQPFGAQPCGPPAGMASSGDAGPGETKPGSTVATAAPSLSPSRAGDFLTCPLLYRFRVIDRLPEPPSAAAARGTLVHAVLERLFDQPAASRTPETARAMLVPQWERLIPDDPALG